MMTRACVQTASRPTRAPPSCPFHVLFHVHLRDLDRLASFHVHLLPLCRLTTLSCQLSCSPASPVPSDSPFMPAFMPVSSHVPDRFHSFPRWFHVLPVRVRVSNIACHG